jgi:NAD(P)-dependent dehydrogenase (short-subunit alcohol dehydrogenase family)
MTTNNKYFRDHVVLVTGGSSGIGLEIARKFVEKGALVIAVGRDKEKLQVESAGSDGRYIARICDVTDEQQIMETSQFVKDSYGKLDVLVNNAGGLKFVAPEQIDDDSFNFHYNVMVKGAMLFVKHFAPLLRKSLNPSIVNISSIASHTIYPNHFLYSSAKAALEKYTQHIVRDLWGIRANVILPGIIDTPIWRSGILPQEEGKTLAETVEDILGEFKRSIPAGRIGLVEDIANSVLFLCSEQATFINGASIVVDGGMMCSGCGF